MMKLGSGSKKVKHFPKQYVWSRLWLLQKQRRSLFQCHSVAMISHPNQKQLREGRGFFGLHFQVTLLHRGRLVQEPWENTACQLTQAQAFFLFFLTFTFTHCNKNLHSIHTAQRVIVTKQKQLFNLKNQLQKQNIPPQSLPEPTSDPVPVTSSFSTNSHHPQRSCLVRRNHPQLDPPCLGEGVGTIRILTSNTNSQFHIYRELYFGLLWGGRAVFCQHYNIHPQ